MKRKMIALILMMSLASSTASAIEADLLHEGDRHFANAQTYGFSRYVAEQRLEEEKLEAEQMKTSSQMSEEERLLAESACRSEVCGCNVKIEDLGTFTATAYCGCSKCSDYFGTLTASGTVCDSHTIAVDPSVIPLGSTVYVEFSDGSIRECHALDTGGAIKGNKIDVYMSEHSDAENFGVQKVRVYLEAKA